MIDYNDHGCEDRVRARVFAFAMVLLACSFWSCQRYSLSKEQAIQIIRESEGLPQFHYITLLGIKRGDPLGREIELLFEGGYLSRVDHVEITEKGKYIVKELYWNWVWKEWEVVEFWTHRIDVGKVHEILVDSKQGTAVVLYELEFKPTPYLEHLLQVDRQQVSEVVGESIPRSMRRRLHLKYWDQGWRATSKPERVD